MLPNGTIDYYEREYEAIYGRADECNNTVAVDGFRVIVDYHGYIAVEVHANGIDTLIDEFADCLGQYKYGVSFTEKYGEVYEAFHEGKYSDRGPTDLHRKGVFEGREGMHGGRDVQDRIFLGTGDCSHINC